MRLRSTAEEDDRQDERQDERQDDRQDDADETVTLFEAPAGDPDDLKRIKGVGAVLEKKLNRLGITRFAQVADFSADDIARVDAVLDFKGRIEREDWIGQARGLAKG